MSLKKIVSGLLGLMGLFFIGFSVYWNLVLYKDLSNFFIVTALGFVVISISILVYFIFNLRENIKDIKEKISKEVKDLKNDVEYVEEKALEHIETEVKA